MASSSEGKNVLKISKTRSQEKHVNGQMNKAMNKEFQTIFSEPGIIFWCYTIVGQIGTLFKEHKN
jgi:hypothetical protein